MTLQRDVFTPGQWYDHFKHINKSPSIAEYYNRVERHFKSSYVFLPEDQVQGKIYSFLRVPNICGKIDRRRMKELKTKRHQRPKLDIQRKTSSNAAEANKLSTISRILETNSPARPLKTVNLPNDSSTVFKFTNHSDDMVKKTPMKTRQAIEQIDARNPLSSNDQGLQSFSDKMHSKGIFAKSPQSCFEEPSFSELNASQKSSSLKTRLSDSRQDSKLLETSNECQVDISSESDCDNAYDTGVMSPQELNMAASPSSMAVEDETVEGRDAHSETLHSPSVIEDNSTKNDPNSSQDMFSHEIESSARSKDGNSLACSNETEIFGVSVFIDTERSDAAKMFTDALRKFLDKRTKKPQNRNFLAKDREKRQLAFGSRAVEFERSRKYGASRLQSVSGSLSDSELETPQTKNAHSQVICRKQKNSSSSFHLAKGKSASTNKQYSSFAQSLMPVLANGSLNEAVSCTFSELETRPFFNSSQDAACLKYFHEISSLSDVREFPLSAHDRLTVWR